MRRGEFAANILMSPPFFMLVATLILPFVKFSVAYPAASIVCATGLLTFLIAKISVIKKGNLTSSGPATMTPGNKKLYYGGYLLMVAGIIFAVVS